MLDVVFGLVAGYLGRADSQQMHRPLCITLRQYFQASISESPC